MKHLSFLPVPSWFVVATSTLVVAARAGCEIVQEPAAKTHTIRDVGAARTIEVVTNRDETIAQFFARQKLVWIDNANTNGKFWSVDQIVKGTAPRFFAPYPLPNAQGFRLYRYGGYYNLEKPMPAVAALFADDLAFNWKNTMLIVKTLTPVYEISDLDFRRNKQPNVRLVGRVFVKDRAKWRPEMDAETLKYREPQTKN